MEIASALTAAPSSPAVPKAAITSDYSTFLKMLTTQMQNQDPLDPMSSADFAVQLATFSGVEQQTRTNQWLETLNGQFGTMGMAQLAGWVGQEARAEVPVWYDGSPVTLSPEPAAGADRAVLVVHDSGGRLVSREDLPASAEPYLWLGSDAAGNPLPHGSYTLTLESHAGERHLATTPVESYARIVEAQSGPGGAVLLLAGGVRVAAAQITALRMP